MNIYVTGPCGSDRKSAAQALAEKYNLKYLDFDSEIEKRDGRSISRICMMMGEHEYRNKEYELLDELKDKDGFVCACSDAILFDPMCLELMKQKKIFIADIDKSPEELWEAACREAGDKASTIHYAFMSNPDEDIKKEKFLHLLEMRKGIYAEFADCK